MLHFAASTDGLLFAVQSFFVDTQHQFTGYEHRRLVDLLSLLALTSIAIWIVVMVSIAARHLMILWLRYSHRRNNSMRKYRKRHDN